MRCFLALELPMEAKGNLASLCERLRPHFPDARWVRPEAFHITLAFLGEIEGPALECARLATEAAGGMGAFDLEFSNLLCLPERGPARVLALEAEQGGRECALVYERVNRTLAKEAQARRLSTLNADWPKGRPFRAHITLARSGNHPLPRDIQGTWPEIQFLAQARCRISRCIVYKSELRRDGARYEALHAVELGT